MKDINILKSVKLIEGEVVNTNGVIYDKDSLFNAENNLKEMINNKSTKKIKQQKKQIYQYEYNKKLFYISNIIIYLLFLLITIISSKGINILSAIVMIIITIVYFYTFCIMYKKFYKDTNECGLLW